MMKIDLTQKDLIKFESINIFKDDIPLLDEVYVVSNRKKHDSGFRCITVYGVAYDKDMRDIIWKKKLSECSDVIHILIPEKSNKLFDRAFSVDFKEVNVARYFVRYGYKFEITGVFSDFEIRIVEDEKLKNK